MSFCTSSVWPITAHVHPLTKTALIFPSLNHTTLFPPSRQTTPLRGHLLCIVLPAVCEITVGGWVGLPALKELSPDL